MRDWADILGCYDGELNTLADLAGDFDAASEGDRLRWIVEQWRRVAKSIGWSAALSDALGGVAHLSDASVVETAALQAFDNWLAQRQSDSSRRDPTHARTRLARAQIRHTALEEIERIGLGRRNLWRVDIPSTKLPNRACYDARRPDPEATPTITARRSEPSRAAPSSAAPSSVAPRASNRTLAMALRLPVREAPADRHMFRAFRADVAPSYFGPRYAMPAVGCSYPVILSLGTFPYVYGGALGLRPPGLEWETGRPWRPATIGMRLAASFWSPVGNLGQDARVVVAQYTHFRKTTDRVLTRVAALTDERAAIVGKTYRKNGLLTVYQGSETMTRVNGPRGAVSVRAYNHVKQSFAAFFAARRAFLRARESLSPAARSALARNPDPCVRARGIAESA